MIRINKKINFSYNKTPLIITEISGNHGGSKKKFLNLIKSAFLNGADLVKIQTYEPEDITLNKKSIKFKIKDGIWKNKYLWELYKKAHTPYSWHNEAFRIAKKNNKILFSSPFSLRAVDFLEKFNVPLYKIASFEITDLKLVKYIASKKKPIILSTGMASINEIIKAIKIINIYHKKIIILHCVSGYPTKLEDTNLNRINILKKLFKNYMIGISDHTDGISSSIAAMSLGIVAIEKHYKLRNDDKTTDSKFSITPKTLLDMKGKLNKLNFSLNGKKSKTSAENNSKILRRSIFSIKEIKKGEKITKKNIGTFRPKIGLGAENYFKILGKIAKKNILKFEPITNSKIK
tara:strand:+ start:7734 stop:8774 length:1041 start_codon:yes stop_codon:yes gene_type:complete